MVGEFRKAPRGFDHLLVTIDKFTKWIKVQPITNLKSERASIFIQDIIVVVPWPLMSCQSLR
jgi:hypothetical protein